MKFIFHPSVMCVCGWVMLHEDAAIRCTNPNCQHYDVRWKPPTVELERIDG